MKAPIYNPLAMGNPVNQKKYADALKRYDKWLYNQRRQKSLQMST